MAQTSQYGRGYNSFSGVDIKGVFANRVIAELQAISYSITREKAPIFTMGSADCRSYSRGKRGIAGTLVFIVFDRHALLGEFGAYSGSQSLVMPFLSDIDDLVPDADITSTAFSSSVSATGGTNLVVNSTGTPVQNQESGISNVGLVENGGDQVVAAPWYSDQIPPFDITLAAANEYGSLATMRIFGAELLNEGMGVSIDDLVVEQQNSYVARSVLGWRPAGQVPLTLTGTSSNNE